MSSDRRSHPTVRPHALALGVVARPGLESRLAFLGAPLAAEVASAMLTDALGALSTFPVKHRVMIVEEGDGTIGSSLPKVPATWKRHALPASGAAVSAGSLARGALTHLFTLGGEAALVVVADGPVMPLGELFDGLLGLATPPNSAPTAASPPTPLLVGPLEAGGIFAAGMARHDAGIGDAISWDEPSLASLEALAAAGRVELRKTGPSYVVDSPAALRRLKKDVVGGAFAPLCRKLLDRPDVERALAAAGA